MSKGEEVKQNRKVVKSSPPPLPTTKKKPDILPRSVSGDSLISGREKVIPPVPPSRLNTTKKLSSDISKKETEESSSADFFSLLFESKEKKPESASGGKSLHIPPKPLATIEKEGNANLEAFPPKLSEKTELPLSTLVKEPSTPQKTELPLSTLVKEELPLSTLVKEPSTPQGKETPSTQEPAEDPFSSLSLLFDSQEKTVESASFGKNVSEEANSTSPPPLVTVEDDGQINPAAFDLKLPAKTNLSNSIDTQKAIFLDSVMYKLQPGVHIGEYELQEKIGEGGMGEVWRALQPQINKNVAIKVLHHEMLGKKTGIARFLQEARSVNEIRHRNLVDIFSFGELADGRPYFVMEQLQGKNLAQYMHDKGLLSLSEILVIIEQVCRALQATHACGVIHRDLKPDNIFLLLENGSKPFVKLLDFGIAKLAENTTDEEKLTKTGAILGTPIYMAPEQCEKKPVDGRVDIYAIGVIIFEMLAGIPPFLEEADSAYTLVAKKFSLDPPLVSSVAKNRDIPEALDQFLFRVLSKDREKRPKNCEEFYEGLLETLKGLNEADFQPYPEMVLKNPRDKSRESIEDPLAKLSYSSPDLRNHLLAPAFETEETAHIQAKPKKRFYLPLLGLLCFLLPGIVYLFLNPSQIQALLGKPPPKAASTPLLEVSKETIPLEDTAKIAEEAPPSTAPVAAETLPAENASGLETSKENETLEDKKPKVTQKRSSRKSKKPKRNSKKTTKTTPKVSNTASKADNEDVVFRRFDEEKKKAPSKPKKKAKLEGAKMFGD